VEETLKHLCEPHFWAIVITIGVMTLFAAAGVGLRPVINVIIKWLSKTGTEVNINLGANEEEEMGRHKTASEKEVDRHSDRMGEIMVDSRTDAFHLFQKFSEKEIDRIDKRVDTLWEHHEAAEKELLAKIETLGKDAIARHDQLKEGISIWKKEVLHNTQLILEAIKAGGK
jgi:hypothetical protein